MNVNDPKSSQPRPVAMSPAAQLPSVADSHLIRSALMVQGSPGLETGQGPPGLAGAPTWSTLMQALRRRWVLAVPLALAAAGVVILAIMLVFPARYTAVAQFEISGKGDQRIHGENHADESQFLLYKNNLAAQIRGAPVVNNALNRMSASKREIKDLSIVRAQGNPVEWLETALKTDFLLGPQTLRVKLSGDRPDETAELLNAVAQAFLEEVAQEEQQKRKQYLDKLQESLGALERELTQKRQQLQLRTKGSEDPATRLARYTGAVDKVKILETKLTDKELDFARFEKELANLKEQAKRLPTESAPDDELNKTLREHLKAKLVFEQLDQIGKDIEQARKVSVNAQRLEQEIALYESQRRRLQAELQKLRDEVRPELEVSWRDRRRRQLDTEMFLTQQKMDVAKIEKDQLERTLVPAREEMNRLAPHAAVLPADVVKTKQQIENLEKAQGRVAESMHIMRSEPYSPRCRQTLRAAEPNQRDYSRQIKFAGAGAAGLFFLVLFGVAFVEFRARKICGPDELTRGLGLSVVGTVPALPAAARSKSGTPWSGADTSRHQQLHEAVDAIRTQLLHASRTDNLRVIMISSAVGHEGKTTLASQLAVSLARAWRKTLLIDGDLRKPAAHTLFQLPQDPGFSEVLRGEVNPTDAIRSTPLSRLWLMPAGHWDSHAIQAMAQDHVRTLLEQLKQQYDFIIVDSCPILPVADSLLLGQHVDGMLFSVMRDYSRAPAVHAAQQKIANLGIRFLGAVMLGAKPDGTYTKYLS